MQGNKRFQLATSTSPASRALFHLPNDNGDFSASQLRVNSELFRLLFDQNPHPMWIYDKRTLRFLCVNDASIRNYKYSRDEFAAMTVDQLLAPEELSSLGDNLDNVFGDSVVSRIFEAFYRLRTTCESTEGTGLGLAISQRLVELHGSQLGLRSEVGEGSCFYFSLPIVPGSAGYVSHQTRTKRSAYEAPRILVVEDDAGAARLICSQLASSGYEAVRCEEPRRACEMAAEIRPDAITLNLHMKPMNGWEVLVALKGDQSTTAIPVVVVSIADQSSMGAILGDTLNECSANVQQVN